MHMPLKNAPFATGLVQRDDHPATASKKADCCTYGDRRQQPEIMPGSSTENDMSEDTQGPDRRTVLAADRTVYAAERTYAAWMRTGLTALASGIGAKALLANVVPEILIVTTGTILVAFSAFCFVVAVIREFRPGPPPPEPDVKKIPSGLLLVVSGFLVVVSFAALIGVWFGRSGAVGH